MCICIALANAAKYSKKYALRMFSGNLMAVMLQVRVWNVVVINCWAVLLHLYFLFVC
jgi:hypothetical protein